MGKSDNRLWDLRLSELIMFCIHNKRFVGASESASDEEKRLYNWVRTQIGAYKRGTLSQYRIDRLNGFCAAILNDDSKDANRAVTEQIRATYTSAISPVLSNSGMSTEKLKSIRELDINSDSEATAALAWATVVISGYDDLKITDADKQKAVKILNAADIMNEQHKITVKSRFARNLAVRLDSTFEINSLYLLLAILGPDAAWRVVFNSTKQEQMCARIRECVMSKLTDAELDLIATRFYGFKSLDDTATILRKSKDDAKELEASALKKLRDPSVKEYIINNIRELNGEKVSGGILTNFEKETTQTKLKARIKG